jgi:hypothetical protein
MLLARLTREQHRSSIGAGGCSGCLSVLKREGPTVMMNDRMIIGAKVALLAGALASSIFVPARAQSAAAAPARPATAAPAPAAPAPTTYRPSRFPRRAGLYYGLVWGVDSLSVKLVESGEIVRFSYYVLDPERAKALNDKQSEPLLYDLKARVKLVVPSLEKVGQLRQSSTPEAHKAYWMAFSNKGRPVKRGDTVAVVIGKFRAENLIVE